jgi:hypothetical protein
LALGALQSRKWRYFYWKPGVFYQAEYEMDPAFKKNPIVRNANSSLTKSVKGTFPPLQKVVIGMDY